MFGIDLYPEMLGLVPEVESYHCRNAALQNLEGKAEVSFQVGGINYINHQIRRFQDLH